LDNIFCFFFIAVQIIVEPVQYAVCFSLPEATTSTGTSAAFVSYFENARDKSMERLDPSRPPSQAATSAVAAASSGGAVVAAAGRSSHVVGRKSAKMATERLSRQKSGESLQVRHRIVKNVILPIYLKCVSTFV
jgi:hypothetical protein